MTKEKHNKKVWKVCITSSFQPPFTLIFESKINKKLILVVIKNSFYYFVLITYYKIKKNLIFFITNIYLESKRLLFKLFII